MQYKLDQCQQQDNHLIGQQLLNIKIRKIKVLISIFFVTIVLFSCSHPKPNSSEIVGNWIGLNNGILIFNKDGTFQAKSLPSDFFYVWNKLDNNSFNGSGNWEIIKSKSIEPYWLLDITFQKTSVNKSNFGMPLMIARSGLGGSSSEITSLFKWKGDPDEDNRYEFYKE